MFDGARPKVLPPNEVSTALPAPARRLLIEAMAIEPAKPHATSLERSRALDHAIERVKQSYPQFFK